MTKTTKLQKKSFWYADFYYFQKYIFFLITFDKWNASEINKKFNWHLYKKDKNNKITKTFN